MIGLCILELSFFSKRELITREEYENLNDYLYIPYHECGGNGTAEKLMCDVKSRLTIVNDNPDPLNHVRV